MLAGAHAARPDQNRPTRRVHEGDSLDNRPPLVIRLHEHAIGRLRADTWLVRRNRHDRPAIHQPQLAPRLNGRARHPAKPLVKAVKLLKADARQRVLGRLDFEPFLGLDRRVQPIAPRPVGHEPAGELVHDHDLAVLNDILLAAGVHVARGERLGDKLLAAPGSGPDARPVIGQGRQLVAAGPRYMNLAVTPV